MQLQKTLNKCKRTFGWIAGFLWIGAASLTFYLFTVGVNDQIYNVDVAVVLGNRINPDGRPAIWTQARLDRTVELYQAGWFNNIIVSGGIGVEGFDEAKVMKDYLVTAGIPEDAIIVDSEGVDTYATAQNSAAIMRTHGWQSAIVITQYYHIARARLSMLRCGITQIGSARARGITLNSIPSLARELFAFPAYFLGYY